MTKKIQEIMHIGVETHAPDTPLTSLAKTMKAKDIGAVPIVENGQLIGMVTDRDIAIRAVANGKDISKLMAKDVMSKGVACCKDTDTTSAAERLMETERVRRLPVVGANKKLVGMVSLGDLSHALSNELSGRLTKAVSSHHA